MLKIVNISITEQQKGSFQNCTDCRGKKLAPLIGSRCAEQRLKINGFLLFNSN